MRLAVGGQAGLPFLFVLFAAIYGFTEEFQYVAGYEEPGLQRPAKVLLGAIQFLDARRFAVRLLGAGALRQAVTDYGAHADQRRPRVNLGSPDSSIDAFDVVAIGHVLDVPAVCFEASAHVLCESQIGAAIDGNVVVVVKKNNLAQLQVTGN